MLVEEGVKSKEQLIDDLQLSHLDIERLIGEDGYMREADLTGRPVLKSLGDNVISFPKR